MLEDFRDLDAAALEETKATVRPHLPLTYSLVSCFEAEYFQVTSLNLKGDLLVYYNMYV